MQVQVRVLVLVLVRVRVRVLEPVLVLVLVLSNQHRRRLRSALLVAPCTGSLTTLPSPRAHMCLWMRWVGSRACG